MNPNLLRGTLYMAGFSCPAWAFAVSFWTVTGFLILMIAGMVCLTAAGFIDYQDRA